MSDPNALGGKVHPTNQGGALTCTRHAIAKAIVQHALYQRLDFNQDYVLGVVENFRLTLEAVYPSAYNDQQFHFMDRTYDPTGLNKHYTITAKVAEIPVPWEEAVRQLKERQRVLEEEARKAKEEKQWLLKKIFTFALIPPFAAFLLVLPKPGIVWAMSGVGALVVLGVNLLTEPVDSSITKEDVDEAL
uniref:Uncharacterized protein n=2 Tax=Clytia hemisphaerica TaxID=252671 RepID=A0A7M5UZC9_9CNID